MSLSCRSERSLISHEEYEVVRITHHPAIYEVEADDLQAARKALALRRTTNFDRPAAGDTANPGMQALAAAQRRKIVTGKRIGSVSQAVKASQARRDKR
jgi:hypothetical protein